MDSTSRMPAVVRWFHAQAATASFVVILFFAGTGLILNHPRWFSGLQRTTVYRSAFDPEWTNPAAPSEVAKLDIVEELRSAHGVRGAVTDFTIDEMECRVAFAAPGYSASALINRRTGSYELTVVRRGLDALLKDLHEGRAAGPVWSILIDLSAVMLTIGALSGLFLAFTAKQRRVAAFLSLSAGAAILCAVYVVWVP